MKKCLISCVNTYRFNELEDVENFHEELKNNENFELTNFSYTVKAIKQKGEIIEEYYVVKAKLVFTDEKYPEVYYGVEYNEL